LNSTSPNNNAHPLLNIEKNEARFFFFSLSPLVHLQGIEEHRQGVEFTLCHSKEAKNLSNLVAIHHQEARACSNSIDSKSPCVPKIERKNKSFKSARHQAKHN